MKTCTKCKAKKDPAEFNRCSSTKDSLQPWCKCCLSDYRKARRNGPDRALVLIKDKQYHDAKREKITPEQKEAAKKTYVKRKERYRKEIDPRYVAHLIVNKSTVFTAKTVPKELIHLKQAHLKLTRLIKEMK